jgi:lysophospholipase L1-like esterase
MRHLRRPAVLLALAALLPPLALAQPTDWAAHYQRRVEAFRAENRALPAGRRHVVLVGDSLTEGWTGERVRRFLPGIAERVLNRGIASDGVGVHARGVLRRLDESVFDARPERVVLLIGVNDVGRDGSGVEPCARRYRELVRAIRARLPDVPLHVVTLAPARGNYAALNPHIVAFNRLLRQLAGEEGAAVIDLHAALADDRGELPAELTGDGLHWNDRGYERVGAALLAGIGARGVNGALDGR